jgi:hypothetical protein
MRQFYDPRIVTDYSKYFCRGVQQAANLLYRLSSKDHNSSGKNKYKLKTFDYVINGSITKISQSLDSDYDFNAHTVNEMFEFLGILSYLSVINWFGQDEIQLERLQIAKLKKIGYGGYEEEIYKYIQQFDFTSHAKTNGFRARELPNLPEDS